MWWQYIIAAALTAEYRQPAWTWPPVLQSGQHILTAADPLAPDLRDALALTKRPGGVH